MIVKNCCISGFTSTRIVDMKVSMMDRKLRSNDKHLSNYELSKGCRVGIDSHADTSCAGRHVRILEYIDGKTYSVSPFNERYQPMENIRMINGIVAVDKSDGSGYIVELNNFLDFTTSMTD